MNDAAKNGKSEAPHAIRNIKKATVIGAGAMGSTIAAHLANAGVDVYLLDIVPKDATDRNILAKNAVDRMKKASPATDPLNAGFMHASNAKRITVGNREDDLAAAVAESDWVVEVIIEDLDLKKGLYAEIERHRKDGAIVSSNTSTIPLEKLVEGRGAAFKKNFVITHFFNPPRFMRLLELVSGPETDPAVTQAMRDFCDIRLGKEVVVCNDRPGFIANRIGTYFLFRAVSAAIDRGMRIEDVDAVLGRPMGFPKDGVFGLIDMVGLGLIPHVTKSLHTTLPPEDMFQKIYREEPLIRDMLADGRWGRNSGKGGFYRMRKTAEGGKALEAIDLRTGEYRPKADSKLESVKAGKQGPRATLESKDAGGEFAWAVMRDTLVYALSLVPEVTDDINAVDTAMREGYNWKFGPFELVERIGKEWFARKLQEDGMALPPALRMAGSQPFFKTVQGVKYRMDFNFDSGVTGYRPVTKPEGVLSLATIKATRKPLLHNRSASLWDIGDGVVCLEFHSKGNTLDPLIFKLMNDTIDMIADSKGRYKAMVVYNDDKDFSLGANLGLAAIGFGMAAHPLARKTGLQKPMEGRVFKMLEEFIYEGQATYKALRYAPFPVVGAPAGMAFGGGCEILLHCDAIQAHAETYMGLVEGGVGLVPAWGGMARYMERVQDVKDGFKGGPFPRVKAAFEAIMLPQFAVSTSGLDAQKKLWLRPQDSVTMNRDRVLTDAKAKAVALVAGYQPPQPALYRLPGVSMKHAINMAIDDFYIKGDATWHDVAVADVISKIVTGGDTHIGKTMTENDILQMEREGILSLARTEQTRKRIFHMLSTNKPLREEPLTEKKTMAEIRANRADITLPRRDPDGKPLHGVDAMRLKMMATGTGLLYRLVPQLRR